MLSKEYSLLITFLLQLIDIQIKKYHALATVGIGPDAGINAKLTQLEVQELLSFAESLIPKKQETALTKENYTPIVLQIHFYIQQEHLRSRAAFLVDENNIHNAVFSRLQKQTPELSEIAKQLDIDLDQHFEPTTDIQKQCHYDSCEIIVRILDTAFSLTNNPNLERPDSIPEHAFNILQKHAQAGGRYHDKTIHDEMALMLKNANQITQSSTRTKSTVQLDKNEAKKARENDLQQFSKLLERFKMLNPTSKLFAESHVWYAVGKISSDDDNLQQQNTTELSTSDSRTLASHSMYSLFSRKTATYLAAAGVALTSVILATTYSNTAENDNNGHTFN